MKFRIGYYSFFFLIPFCSSCQNNSSIQYFQGDDGKVYSKRGFDSLLSHLNQDSLAKYNHHFHFSFTKKKVRHDSTIITFNMKYGQSPSPFRDSFLNKSLPSFTLKDLNGVVINSEDLRGRVILINFWSTTCSPCIMEFADLNRLKEKYADKVIFLAFAPESKKKVNKVLSDHPFNYIIIPEAKQFLSSINCSSYPKNLFVDKEGIIREVTEGTLIGNNKNVMIFGKYDKILKDLIDQYE